MKLSQRTLQASGPFNSCSRWLLRWRYKDGKIVLYLLDLHTVAKWI